MKLCNSFSLTMIPPVEEGEVREVSIRRITLEEAKQALHPDLSGCESYVGHQSTADILGDMLGFPVACHREKLEIRAGDQLMVAQYHGPRLPEGATVLPEGAVVMWYIVEPKPSEREREEGHRQAARAEAARVEYERAASVAPHRHYDPISMRWH